MSRSIITSFAVGLALTALPALAVAQPSPAPDGAPTPTDPKKPLTEDDLAKAQREDARPWAKGVTPEEQQIALGLFKEGNVLIRDQLWPKAVEKYRAALEHWKHPAIYYNLALALVNLDQPLEIYDALEAAMAYGVGPLDAEKLDRAKSTKLLVEKQIGSVEYTIDVSGATLVLDGAEVFTGPGRFDDVVRAGRHTWTVRVGARSLPARAIVLDGGGRAALPDVDGELGP